MVHMNTRSKWSAKKEAMKTRHSPRQKKRTPSGEQIATDKRFERLDTECHHIIRLEKTEKTAPGWKINLKRRGRYMHKYFTDTKYGGRAKALRAAKVYRDSLMAVASGAEYAIWRRNKMPESNTSGIVGVGRYAVKYRRKTRLL